MILKVHSALEAHSRRGLLALWKEGFHQRVVMIGEVQLYPGFQQQRVLQVSFASWVVSFSFQACVEEKLGWLQV